MARSYTFICDGCDGKTERNTPERPRYWADVTIVASGFTNWRGGGDADVTRLVLLCQSCQIALADRIDPKAWPRCQDDSPSVGPAGGQPAAAGDAAREA